MFDNEEIPAEHTSLVLISARESHGIKAASDSRLVGMFIKEPFSASFK